MNRPLSEAEYARIAAMLERSERAMNVEILDGFFAALICGPDVVRPSEYLKRWRMRTGEVQRKMRGRCT